MRICRRLVDPKTDVLVAERRSSTGVGGAEDLLGGANRS